MALVVVKVTVPASTPDSSPLIIDVAPGLGFLQHVAISFYEGSGHGVKVQIRERDSVIVPAIGLTGPAPGKEFPWVTGGFTADGETIAWDEGYQLNFPYRLQVRFTNSLASAKDTAVRMVFVQCDWRRNIADLADAAALWRELAQARREARPPRLPEPIPGTEDVQLQR